MPSDLSIILWFFVGTSALEAVLIWLCVRALTRKFATSEKEEFDDGD